MEENIAAEAEFDDGRQEPRVGGDEQRSLAAQPRRTKHGIVGAKAVAIILAFVMAFIAFSHYTTSDFSQYIPRTDQALFAILGANLYWGREYGTTDTYWRGDLTESRLIALQRDNLYPSLEREPGYPYFLALLYRLAGGIDYQTVLMLQGAFCLFFVNLLLLLLVFEMTDKPLLPSLVAAFTANFIFGRDYTILMPSGLTQVLMLSSVYCSIRIVASRRPLLWSVLAGISFGLLVFTRFSYVAMVFLFAVVIFFKMKSRRLGLRLGAIGALLILFACPNVLWMLHNKKRFGEFGHTVRGGVNFVGRATAGKDFPPWYEVEFIEKRTGKKMPGVKEKPFTLDREMYKIALNEIRQSPSTYLNFTQDNYETLWDTADIKKMGFAVSGRFWNTFFRGTLLIIPLKLLAQVITLGYNYWLLLGILVAWQRTRKTKASFAVLLSFLAIAINTLVMVELTIVRGGWFNAYVAPLIYIFMGIGISAALAWLWRTIKDASQKYI